MYKTRVKKYHFSLSLAALRRGAFLFCGAVSYFAGEMGRTVPQNRARSCLQNRRQGTTCYDGRFASIHAAKPGRE